MSVNFKFSPDTDQKMELRQSKSSLKTKLLDASQTARSVLASIDQTSVQLSDHDALECCGKVEPDIQHLLHDMTKFLSSLVEQPPNLYELLENFQSSLQISFPFDAASERGRKAVGFRSCVDPPKVLHRSIKRFLQYNNIADHVKMRYSVEELKELVAFCKAYILKVEHGDAKIGGKPKKQNRQAQCKKDIQAREKAKTQQQSQSSKEEESVHEIFSRYATITKDWTLEKGFVIGPVFDQKKDNICWAIVLVRILQAIYNIGRPENQQHEFSVYELVDQIKPGEDKDLKLSNLNLAFNHIKGHGVMKKPPATKNRREKAVTDGFRVKKTFELRKDVNDSFIQEKLDRSPVGLSLEITQCFEELSKEQIYILPKKPKIITPETRLHIVLVVGYGFTEDGQLYFIIQNSWGETWGLRGFARIIINHECDVIICLDD